MCKLPGGEILSYIAGVRKQNSHSIRNEARTRASKHVANEEPSESLACLVALIPSRDGEETGGNKTRFAKSGM